jgi:formate dehydrogenase
MAKVVCVLYDDPVDGYPKSYPRDDLPKIDRYPDGQTLPTPKASWACGNTSNPTATHWL